MSKKDYIAIAKILSCAATLEEAVRLLADYFAEDNPRFDREHFFKAAAPQKLARIPRLVKRKDSFT